MVTWLLLMPLIFWQQHDGCSLSCVLRVSTDVDMLWCISTSLDTLPGAALVTMIEKVQVIWKNMQSMSALWSDSAHHRSKGWWTSVRSLLLCKRWMHRASVELNTLKWFIGTLCMPWQCCFFWQSVKSSADLCVRWGYGWVWEQGERGTGPYVSGFQVFVGCVMIVFLFSYSCLKVQSVILHCLQHNMSIIYQQGFTSGVNQW